MEPASRIIGLLGGPTRVAEICGVHRTRPFKWQKSRDEGGTGGVIPHWHVGKLLTAAKEAGVQLSAGDFAPVSQEAAE